MYEYENNYDFKVNLLGVHKKDVRDYNIKPRKDEYVFSDDVTLVCGISDSEVVYEAAKDFIDYLYVSMGISAALRKEKAEGRKDIIISYADDLTTGNGYMGYRITVGDKGIKIEGHDERGIAQALYYMEDLMNIRKAPYLKKGVTERKALFTPRITQSPFGINEYPDEAFRLIAHRGLDAIDLWLQDPYTDKRGYYIDVRLICERAKKYGIDVYIQLYAAHSAHPDDEGAQEFYDNLYGNLFKVCPDIKGITLIGEANQFASRDPAVGKTPYAKNFEDNIPTGKTSPGWWPCRDYPAWVSMIKRAVEKYSKKAEIVFCTYNWGYAPEEERIRLINSLPDGIAIMATWDMFHKYKLGNSTEDVCDYTLSFEGPGEYFKSEAAAAKARGLKVYSISNTLGRTWDFGVIPYEPMPEQWIKRYKARIRANEEYGLKGLLENIHYGFYPSFIADIEKQAFFTEVKPLEEVLREVLIRDYGEENLKNVKRATENFSRAIRHYVPTNEDQYGAYRIGPAYPLWSGIMEGLPSTIPEQGRMPSYPHAMFGNGIYFGVYTPDTEGKNSLPGVRIFDEIKSTKKMLELFEKGIKSLEECEKKNKALTELIDLAKFMKNTVITALNVKRHYILKQRLSVCGTKEKAEEIIKEIEKIVLSERENVLDTIPLVKRNSRLGWEPSMEYTTDEKGLKWKLKQLDYELKVKIPTYRKANRL